ncbi:3-oxoacyl-ACP synthase III [Planctomicrobium piriforme]|uniref:3-oxoacyl-[acyl-carrier-protein] synthase-3 n=1 Tax=Planctomicrobium piriforme TaxID=1576369 RepID=A0A1I3E7K2_9PLAN|nr:3-oxoacyl-ACP synthase III [Planctomicrobium piriforme]SFH94972.1 3-oxoacyl-[acyl-carrier-protein] synthase-3 [Planctomicrobium piriforme]
MRYQRVCVDAFVTVLPPEVVTSDQIEEQLAPVYERLSLPAGRLELMSGIRERRFFPHGTLPGQISGQTVQKALQVSQLDPALCGALIHGSVCRDQMEPATAAGVHQAAGLPGSALVLDFSNACLGLLNGMLAIADMIELGRIQAGIVVGTETGRPLVEGTIAKLLRDPQVTRKSIKLDFASLTIGSGSAAIVLCDESISKTGNRLLGGGYLADTSHHNLCAGGTEAAGASDGRPAMSTDSEALLHAGVALAEQTWELTKQNLGWQNETVNRVFTHQVGKAHRALLLQRLGLAEELDFPTVEFLGNTGAAALPTAVALGLQRGVVQSGDQMALLGIGSGLNSIMLGLDWQKTLFE